VQSSYGTLGLYQWQPVAACGVVTVPAAMVTAGRFVDLGLTGKVALVVGASKGLGKGCALALAREGARVAICARSEGQLEVTAASIRDVTGAEVLVVPGDVAKASDIRRVVAATAERFGGVDILINNSGGPRIGSFPDLTDEDWQQAFELVTLNFVRFVREVVPHMRARQWGRIIGIQSSSVKQPVRNIDLSNGIRPGIAGLMKALMPDLARDGITINLVLPGSFLTSRISPGLDEGRPSDPDVQARLKPLAQAIPVGRLGDPIELGDLVAYLASQRAGFITGAAYQIDGGIISSNV
jgi:3-oxoacyl-[acyl-carrier protein] reductase